MFDPDRKRQLNRWFMDRTPQGLGAMEKDKAREQLEADVEAFKKRQADLERFAKLPRKTCPDCGHAVTYTCREAGVRRFREC